LVKNSEKESSEPIDSEVLETPIRRQTYLVGDKENLPNFKKNTFKYDSNITNSNCSFKRPDKQFQDRVFNDHFNIQNQMFTSMSDDSLDGSSKKVIINNSPLNDFYLTPLKSTENIQNILSPFSTTKKIKSFDISNEHFTLVSFDTSPFQPKDASTAAKVFTPEEKKSTRVSVNLCNKFEKLPENKQIEVNTTFIKDTINSHSSTSFPEVEQSFDFRQKYESKKSQTSNAII